MKRLWVLFFLFYFNTQLWAGITAHVDAKLITKGTPFTLMIRVDGNTKGLPDISALNKDFIIVGTEQRSSLTVINGKAHSQQLWKILLQAKKSGVLTIPALDIDGQTTNPIQITVEKKATSLNSPPKNAIEKEKFTDPQKEVLLTASIDTKMPYLNQQTIYTVRLYNARRLVDIEFTPPTVDNALMLPLGDSRHFETNKQGRRFAVEEQRYAIFPLKSGPLTIKPPKLSALIYDGFPQRIHESANSIKLKVKAVPNNNSVAMWLPAHDVTLEEQYNIQSNTLFTNDTLVREVTVNALGMTSELVPPYSFTSPTGVNLYEEKPKRKNYLQNNEVLGTISFKLTYLFNEPGKVTIPEFRLRWFNSKVNKMQTATLPERTLTIQGQSTHSSNKAPPNTEALKELRAIGDAHLKLNKHQSYFNATILYWAAGILFILLAVVAYYLIKIRKQAYLIPTIKEAEQSLKKACMANDPQLVKEHLLQWANLQWPQSRIINLADVAKKVADQGVIGQIHKLSDLLYADKKEAWSGHAFWLAFKNYCQKKPTSKKANDNLPPMNPF